MKKIRILALATVLTGLMACNKDRVTGSGAIITQERNVANFTKVLTAGSTDVIITKGATFSVAITGYGNLLPYFETKLHNNVLQLGYKNNVSVKNDNLKVYVTMPVLNGLSVAGSADITATGNFSGNTNFETSISGSGNIHISEGSTTSYFSNISGSGDVYAFGMLAEKADIRIAGSGDHEISASNELKVNIAGSGNVYYKNSPTITSQIIGSGSVIPR